MLHGAASHLIQADLRRHAQILAAWVRRVETARTPQEAARLAQQRPLPSGLLRSLRALTRSEAARADARVAVALERHVAALEQALAGLTDPDSPMHLSSLQSDLAALMAASRGTWPRLWRRLETARCRLADAAASRDTGTT